jgi:hypothetical protein
VVSKSQLLRIDEFAQLVHPRNGHQKFFLMLEAYLDESGIHEGADICIVAGFFGRQHQWRKLEREWKRVLNKFKMPLSEFHAKDIVKQSRHKRLLQELANAIASSKVFPVSAGVIVPDFNSLTLEQKKFITGATLRDGKLIDTGSPGKPYFGPFQLCLMRVTHDAPQSAKVHCFFGLDRPFAGYARTMFAKIKNKPPTPAWPTKDRLGDPHFPQAKETPELQAADLFAYLSYKRALACYGAKQWNLKATGVLATCLRNTKNMNVYHVMQDRACLLDTFRKTAHQIGIPSASPILTGVNLP